MQRPARLLLLPSPCRSATNDPVVTCMVAKSSIVCSRTVELRVEKTRKLALLDGRQLWQQVARTLRYLLRMINLVVWIVPGSTNDCSSSLCCATWSENGHFGVLVQLASRLGPIVIIDWE